MPGRDSAVRPVSILHLAHTPQPCWLLLLRAAAIQCLNASGLPSVAGLFSTRSTIEPVPNSPVIDAKAEAKKQQKRISRQTMLKVSMLSCN